MRKNDSKLDKLFGGLLMALIIFLILSIVYLMFVWLFPGLFPLVKAGDDQAIAAYIQQEGSWKGIACSFILCVLQVLSIVIPGVPIQVATGCIYGFVTACLVCYLGFIAGNVFVFCLARRVGQGVSKFLPIVTKENWLTKKINSSHPAFIVGIACMVPGVPNGIIPYIAARTKMTIKGYATAVAASSWLQIITNCACGYFLIRGKYILAVGVFVIQLIIIAIITMNRESILGKIE